MQKPSRSCWHQFFSSALTQRRNACTMKIRATTTYGALNCHHTDLTQVSTTSWSSTWSLFHYFASITLVQMESINFFVWKRPLIEFRGSFFWIKKNFSEQSAYTSCLWVPTTAFSEPLQGGSLTQRSHQHQLMAHEGSKGSVLQPSWVLAEGGLCHCLLWCSSSQEDPEGSKNMICSYYKYQSASCGHIFLFQMDSRRANPL